MGCLAPSVIENGTYCGKSIANIAILSNRIPTPSWPLSCLLRYPYTKDSA